MNIQKIFPAEYFAWHDMQSRCTKQEHISFANYGGRGISICRRWDTFERFFEDMGRRPGPKYSLDRVDNNGPYSPANCRWATPKQQQNNRRCNKFYEYCGHSKTAPQWARLVGIDASVLTARLKLGWKMERALHTAIASHADSACKEAIA